MDWLARGRSKLPCPYAGSYASAITQRTPRLLRACFSFKGFEMKLSQACHGENKSNNGNHGIMEIENNMSYSLNSLKGAYIGII